MSGRQEQDACSGDRISYKLEEDCEAPGKCLEKSCTGYLYATVHTQPLKFIFRRSPKNSR